MRRWGDHGKRLTVADHSEIQRRVSAGETFASAAAAVGCSTKSIQRFMARTGGLVPRVRDRSPWRLSVAECSARATVHAATAAPLGPSWSARSPAPGTGLPRRHARAGPRAGCHRAMRRTDCSPARERHPKRYQWSWPSK